MKFARKINLGSALNGGIANQTVIHASNLNATQAKQQNVLSDVGNTSNSKLGSSLGFVSSVKGLYAAGKGVVSLGSALLHAGSINGALKDFGGPAVLYESAGPQLPYVYSIPFQNVLGFSQDTPIILLSSEFLPLTGTLSANDRDFALITKEQSVLLTSKNAILILSKEDSTKALIEKHRQENITIIKKLNNKAAILLKALADADEALNIRMFSHVPRTYLSPSKPISAPLFPFFGDNNMLAAASALGDTAAATQLMQQKTNNSLEKSFFVNFKQYLEQLGWTTGEAAHLSPTALYQQFLIETKRSLHTLPRTIAAKSNTGSGLFDNDKISKKYNLRGLYRFNDRTMQIEPIEEIDKKDAAKFFVHYNVVNKLPASDFDDMFKIKEYYRCPSAYSVSLKNILSRRALTQAYGSSPSPGLAINAPPGFLTDIYNEKADFILPSPNEISLRHFLADTTIMKNLQDPQGIYMFTKEINFSKSLKAPEIAKSLKQNSGYSVTLTADRQILTDPHLCTNTLVWDALLGDLQSFKRSILDLGPASTQQFGQDYLINPLQVQEQSLVGLSRAYARATTIKVDLPETFNYSVLTFEKGDMPLIDDSPAGLTPGSYYYVDSSLFTTDFKKFDTSRVDFLMNYLASAKQNMSLIKSIYSGKLTPTDSSIYKMVEDASKDDPYLKAVKKLDPFLVGAYKETLSVGGTTVTIDNKKKRDILYTDAGLQWQGASIVAATIFKHAIVNKDMKCLRLLFQIVMRETYKKLFSDFSVDYPEFVSKVGAVQEVRKNNEIEYEYNEGDITDDEADYVTISYLEPELAGVGRMSWSNFGDWAVTLIGSTGNANTPELALDAILLTSVGMQGLPNNFNISTAQPQYLFLDECANIGKQTVVLGKDPDDGTAAYLAGKTTVPQFESSETDLLADVFAVVGITVGAALLATGVGAPSAGLVFAGLGVGFGAPVVADNVAGGGLFTTIINTKDFQIGRDAITIADNPVIKRMYTDGKSFIELLGTGLNAEEPFGLFKPIVELMMDFFRLEICKPLTGGGPGAGAPAPVAPMQLFSQQASQQADYTTDYIGSTNESGCTLYSAIPKSVMLWKYFLSICQIISQMTPDNFGGFFSLISETNVGGYRLAPLASDEVATYFAAKTSSVNTIYAKRIDDFVKNYKNLQLKQANMFDIMDQFINNAQKKMQVFRDQLAKDFTPYIEETKSVFDQDRTLTIEQKIALANLSYTPDQLILSSYILSELSDRIDSNNVSESKLKTLPSFIDFPKGFTDFYSLNDFDTVSCGIMSKFFKSEEFNTYFGGNKKIISVGLPPTMMRNILGLTPTPSNISKSFDFKRSIVQINLYKNDILHPGIIFKPKTYCFEARRFPTRIVSNWNSLTSWQNFKDTPSKYYNGSEFVLHQDFISAEKFIKSVVGITDNTNAFVQPEQLYYNFFQSFAAEQYIKWFSKFSVDESRYFNFSGLDDQLKTLTEQFNSYVKSTGASFNIANIIGTNNTANRDLNAITANLGESVKKHLRNETLLLSPSTIKERVLYSKKFDRVFNIIFDPDDFDIAAIDENISDKYVQEGLVTKINNKYEWIRQTQQSDFSFDEYWVTIEPFFEPSINPAVLAGATLLKYL